MNKKLSELIDQQCDYVKELGGYVYLQKSDEYYNSLNHKQIEAFAREYETAWLCNLSAEKESKTVIYTGQPIAEFSCDYILAFVDERMTDLMQKWNASHELSTFKEIIALIREQDGLPILWV